VLLDEAMGGPLVARRRAVALWGPGVTVHRVDALGGLLVRFPVPRWMDCARAPGLPLVRIAPEGERPRSPGPAPSTLVASAPLAAAEIADLAPPAGAAIVVRGGVPVSVVPAAHDAEDPASYLDVSAFVPVPVVALGPAPPPPRVVVAPPEVPARRLLGVADAPPQVAEVLAALKAARLGRKPAPDPAPLSFLAALFTALTAWVARIFRARRDRPAPAPVRASPGRSLVVVSAPTPAAPSALQRLGTALRHFFAKVLVGANLAPFLGRRQAEYVGKMIDLFEQGDLGEALRHAIPLGGDEAEAGEAPPPMIGVPRPRSNLAISGGSGGKGSALYAPEDFYADLRRRYRAAFERLERDGRIEEAAFVLAELLRESAEAVAFLERHGRFRLAAEVAEARGLPPGLLVRQWLLAGDASRAVLLARRHGAFADALARLGQHAQAPVLRMLWAGTLADAGDFAAAVDMAWPLPEARAVAEAWIDAAIAQGGAAAARMLARKLALVPASFPDVRACAHKSLLLDAEDEGAARERRAFAEALLAEPTSPASRTLARPLLRALVRDGSRTGDPATRLLVDRLEGFAGDEALRADRPPWPAERTPRASPGPRTLTLAATDTGATPVHDAAHLPDGRTLLALGEAGVRVLGRGGRPLFDLGQPAHRLVVSDRGDRALALARRGDAWRVARLDLVGRRSQAWCEARFDCTAPDFDGSQWVVAAGSRLLVIDALEARFDALASLDLREAAALAVSRTSSSCVVALAEPGDRLARCRYDLPSWTLRRRDRFDAPFGRSLTTAGPAGAIACLTGPGALPCPSLVCFRDEGAMVQARLDPVSGAEPAGLASVSGSLLCALRSPAGVEVRLFAESTLEMGGQWALVGASRASLRFGVEGVITLADQLRLLVENHQAHSLEVQTEIV
jgi:hypothetical protein